MKVELTESHTNILLMIGELIHVDYKIEQY